MVLTHVTAESNFHVVLVAIVEPVSKTGTKNSHDVTLRRIRLLELSASKNEDLFLKMLVVLQRST